MINQPMELEQVKATDWLGERLNRGYVAVSNLRGSLWWEGSCWGHEHVARWMRNVTLYGQYSGYYHPAMQEVLEGMFTLLADGRAFATYDQNALAAYNEEELLSGFIAHYRKFPDPRVLEAARRMGQSIATNHPKLAGSHYYKSLAIAPLLALEAITHDPAFLKAATDIAEDQQLVLLEIEQGAHGAASSMILCGHLALFETTGSRRYLDWALKLWEAIRQRMFITGGIGEMLFFTAPPSEGDLHDETCQHSWWTLANLQMWRATGDVRYLDLVERILFNHFLFSQLHRGEDAGFCALGDIDQGFRGQHNFICCDNEGFFGLMEVARHAITMDLAQSSVSINLLLPVEVRWVHSNGAHCRVRIETAYPVKGSARITVEMDRAAEFSLRIRIPGGVQPSQVDVNDQVIQSQLENNYVVIDRTWQNNDSLSFVFPIPMRVETDNTGAGAKSVTVTVDGTPCAAKRIGVFHGPVLSALFRTGHDNDLSWIWNGDYPEALDSGGCVFLDYPESKNSYREDVGSGPALSTEVSIQGGMPSIRWIQKLGADVTIAHKVRILPGLPVTIEWHETVEGWDGKGKLLCSGLRYATAKQTKNLRYGDIAFPYPFPAVTTRDDLRASSEFVAGGGSYSLSERLTDGGALSKTGTFRLSNGSFRTICHYDAATIAGLEGKVSANWAGIYFVPVPGKRTEIKRRLIFSLHDQPLSQDLTRLELERVPRISVLVKPESAGTFTITLSGGVIELTPILIPKDSGLKAGWVAQGSLAAASLVDYDETHLIARLPVPGIYRVESGQAL